MSRRSWVFDVAVALIVTGLDIGGSMGEASPPGQAQSRCCSAAIYHHLLAHQPGAFYALVVVAGLALIWRRRYPLVVLAVTVACTATYAGVGFVDGAALIVVLVALYTVATRTSLLQSALLGGAALIVMWVAAGLGGPFGWLGGVNSVRWAVVIAAVALGAVRANRRQLIVAMAERAERAERSREDEARRRVDAERLRIARELHDVVAHSMSVINVQAGVAAHVLDTQPAQAAAALQAIKSASREGLGELRAILNVLRQVDDQENTSPAPDLANLDSLVEAARQAGLDTTVSVTGASRPLPPTIELAAYRIVQESLTNVIRHAAASHAEVRLDYAPGHLDVCVEDDGRSDGGTFSDGAGAGIAGMLERAEAFGGTVEVSRPAPGGWRVRATLPTGPVAGVGPPAAATT